MVQENSTENKMLHVVTITVWRPKDPLSDMYVNGFLAGHKTLMLRSNYNSVVVVFTLIWNKPCRSEGMNMFNKTYFVTRKRQ